MKKSMWKLIPAAAIFLLLIFMGGMTNTVYADDSGKDGALSWKYVAADRELILSGSGSAIYNYYDATTDEYSDPAPWAKYKDEIETVVVKQGVKAIGAYTFRGSHLKYVELPYDIDLQYEPGWYDEESPVYPFQWSDLDELVVRITGTTDVLSTKVAKNCEEFGYFIAGYGWSLKAAEPDYKYDWNDEQLHADFGAIYAEKKYTGSEIKAYPVIRHHGKVLANGTDYTVKFSNNTNVGRAICTVTGTGDYYGTLDSYFAIYPKSTSITKIKGASKAFTVKWLKQSKKMKSERITGYEIRYSTSKNFKKGVKYKTVNGYSNTSKKIKGLKSGRKYYVQVRTYYKTTDDTYKSDWSPKKSVKVR